MIQKNFQGKIPNNDNLLDNDLKLLSSGYNLLPELQILIDQQNYNLYLEKVISLSSLANEYINTEAPWTLKKDNPQRMSNILYSLSETIRVIAIYLLPFMPDSAKKILDLLSVSPKQQNFQYISKNHALKTGSILPIPTVIFPKR